jgi:hypothetical protein
MVFIHFVSTGFAKYNKPNAGTISWIDWILDIPFITKMIPKIMMSKEYFAFPVTMINLNLSV